MYLIWSSYRGWNVTIPVFLLVFVSGNFVQVHLVSAPGFGTSLVKPCVKTLCVPGIVENWLLWLWPVTLTSWTWSFTLIIPTQTKASVQSTAPMILITVSCHLFSLKHTQQLVKWMKHCNMMETVGVSSRHTGSEEQQSLKTTKKADSKKAGWWYEFRNSSNQ